MCEVIDITLHDYAEVFPMSRVGVPDLVHYGHTLPEPLIVFTT